MGVGEWDIIVIHGKSFIIWDPPLPQHTPQTDITFGELTFWSTISPI